MNKPVKPISLAKEELFNEILELINDSKLPPVIVHYVVADVQKLVVDAYKGQYEREVAAYNEEVKKYEKELAEKEGDE